MDFLLPPQEAHLPGFVWLLIWLLLVAPLWGRLVLAFLRDWHRYRDERRR